MIENVLTPPKTAPPRAKAAGMLLGAIIVAGLVNVVIAAVAHAAGASDDFRPLTAGAFLFFTVIGVLAGAAGWAAIRARSSRPAATLRWAVPAVLALSFIPDVAVLASDSMPGTGPGAVLALALMHLAIAAVALPTYLRALPLPAVSS